MKRFGVIDLGTNTFHLLIAEPDEWGGFRELYRERHFIKLAEEGIEKIGAGAFERGLQAMQNFKSKLIDYQVFTTQAIGTAALRTASNGMDFITQVKAFTGIEVQLITGDREAELIHTGVMQAIPVVEERMLIMDIGGGSVEFIIADQNEVFWAQSFPVGVAILYKNYHKSDPITIEEIENIHSFLNQQLEPLQVALTQYPLQLLVGASGTFDVLENILVKNKTHPHHSHLTAHAFPAFYTKIIQTTIAERLSMKGMPAERADMIVVALVLLNHVLLSAQIQHVIISAFAMKEGILHEMMQE